MWPGHNSTVCVSFHCDENTDGTRKPGVVSSLEKIETRTSSKMPIKTGMNFRIASAIASPWLSAGQAEAELEVQVCCAS